MEVMIKNHNNDGHKQSNNTIDINIESFCRNPKFKGCMRKCPCPGLWINCKYWNDEIRKQQRLRQKGLSPEIHEWYDTVFRINWEAPSMYMSG